MKATGNTTTTTTNNKIVGMCVGVGVGWGWGCGGGGGGGGGGWGGVGGGAGQDHDWWYRGRSPFSPIPDIPSARMLASSVAMAVTPIQVSSPVGMIIRFGSTK